MKKETIFSTKGQRADIGNITIYRLLPNRYSDTVGSFVFLDHIAPKQHELPPGQGTGAHPHRGIATLTYVIDGEVEHFDSRGNNQKVHSGGIQWMKAGNGIIHDESLTYDSETDNKVTHAFQFWINLPSGIKAEEPEYMAIVPEEVPVKILEDGNGWLKVIAGNYDGLTSKIPNYLPQFLYHIHLAPGAKFSLEVEKDIEAAALLPTRNVMLNDVLFHAGEFVFFDREKGVIEINNTSGKEVDVLLFGGEQYKEAIVAEGPFIMNSGAGIAEAYRDYYAGKYGVIERQENTIKK